MLQDNITKYLFPTDLATMVGNQKHTYNGNLSILLTSKRSTSFVIESVRVNIGQWRRHFIKRLCGMSVA